jgi:hypothetical protein
VSNSDTLHTLLEQEPVNSCLEGKISDQETHFSFAFRMTDFSDVACL